MLKGVTSGGGGITPGTTVITGGTNTRVLFDDNGVVGESAGLIYVKATGQLTATLLVASTSLTAPLLQAGATGGTIAISTTAGQGPTLAGGTATTDVAALSVTRTNNNAAVATGVKLTFTDTSSATGFEAFGIYAGASGISNVGSFTTKNSLGGGPLLTIGNGSTTSAGWKLGSAASGYSGIWVNSVAESISNYLVISNSDNTDVRHNGNNTWKIQIAGSTLFTASANTLGLGTGARTFISNTAPTVASGGCTSPTVVTANGTAAFSVGVGTGCSGSQPLVFTLPAATTGWQCNARNATNAGTSAPRQSSAASTTSVTITNYGATTGLAGAWSDADVVVVSCLGY